MLESISNVPTFKNARQMCISGSYLYAKSRIAVLALCSVFFFNFSIFSEADAVEKVKSKKQIYSFAKRQQRLGSKKALPFRLGAYTIGDPMEKNNFPGVYSAVEAGPENPTPNMTQYNVSCSLDDDGGDIPVYMGWNNGPRLKEIYHLSNSYSISVIYFISNKDKQYIYGTVSNGRALTDGTPVLVESKYWNCQIFKH